MIGHITALLAGHIASGGLFITALLALGNELPKSFLRFCAAASGASAASAALLDAGASRFVWLGLAIVAGLWYAALRRGAGTRREFLVLPATAAVVAPVLYAIASNITGINGINSISGASGTDLLALSIAGSLSSSLILGAVLVSLILGHWYLVDTSLSIAPLRAGALWLWIAVLLRWAVVVAVLLFGGFEVLKVGRAADLIFSTGGLFFLFRTLMGLIAPLLLTGLIWQTVKIRSTQSATGLLYVASFLVLFGESFSQFLLVATGYPL